MKIFYIDDRASRNSMICYAFIGHRVQILPACIIRLGYLKGFWGRHITIPL